MGNFIGHKEILDNLIERIRKEEISHAHLIVGEDGIGKSSLAKILASNILEVDVEKESVDIINYKLKKASFGVDEVRAIIAEVNKKPYEGDKKVIIIHKGDKLTVQAQNALLKTIEEPPKGVFIILLCESLELILDTIKSRCEIHKLSPLKSYDISLYGSKFLDTYSKEEIDTAVAYSQGIPGKLEEFLKDENLKTLRNTLIELLNVISKGDIYEVLQFENKILSYKDKKDELFNILTSLIRDIIIYKEINHLSGIINIDKIDDLKELSIQMSYKKLNKIVEKINECRLSLTKNSSFSLTIRVMLIGIMEV